jgi:UDP:flavonoid glycosyltransferase YjiC (YdhE family)
MSGRFLFVTWDGSGNLPPTLAAARALAARGHDVRFLGHQSQADRIDFPFRAYRAVPDLYERAPLPPEEVWWDELFLSESPARELLDALEEDRADALVVDCLLWGALAGAERTSLPTAVFVHSVYGPRFAAEDLPERRRRLNATRAACGLQPAESLLHPWERAALVLVASSLAFDAPPVPLPANVVYAGPLREPIDVVVDDLPWQPEIVVSFSTAPIAVPRMTQRVLDALAPMRERCLALSVADGLQPGPNTEVRPWVAHDAIFPRAALVITHGGHGTVTAALSHGVPLLCLPTLADQPVVAERVVETGVGLSLPYTAEAAEVRAGAQSILGDPRYRDAARALQAEIAADRAKAAHIPALESLLG